MPRRSAFERHFEHLHGRPINLEVEFVDDEPLEAVRGRDGRWRAEKPAMASDERYMRLTVGVVGLAGLVVLLPVATILLLGIAALLLG